ncbi:zinc-dependent alcohol dehydrogenase [Amycolatopsis taiwanensis]|uniref:Alcohol dehydrogenase adh n=1 Tax=Amycolatopsis taiwanensis TaxID=342230 RepID=A0A9W6R0Z2_9PSEU|nr:alcohol dehydrogenase catalytic domain-containing protein [Amycolatopsis taiwanensis]GLY65592.1 putative alcohol dehydrogenase adh [Amycolatopsis taiwanensis]
MGETVRAAVQTGPRRLELREFPRPRTGADDALLKVEANGICGSDVETFKGHLGRPGRGPFIPGHEPLGIISEIGEQAAKRWGVAPGDRVALEVIVPCHYCQNCLTGRYQFCPNRTLGHGVTGVDVAPSLWGGFAEYLYLSPGTLVHKIDRNVPVEVAAMYNPLGAGVRWAAQLGGIQLGDTVLVLGAGQRGIASVIAARIAGAGTIIMTGLAADAHKLELAREFGADYTIVVDGEDGNDTVNTVERVADITNGKMADVVLELTPMAAQPISDALSSARHGGRVVLAGLKGGREISLRTDVIIQRGLTVLGAFGVDASANEQAIGIIESGRFPLEKLHTHSFGLDEVSQAIETLAGEVEGEQAVHVSVHPNA